MKYSMPQRLVIFLAVVTAGCAGASTTRQYQAAPVNTARPALVIVYPFAISPANVTLNQSIIQRGYRSLSGEGQAAEQENIARDLAQNLCHQIAHGLVEKGYQAICQEKSVPIASDNALIVDGEFTNVSEGNRLRRTMIGFGAGASTLDTNVVVYQNSGGIPRQILAFSTHADSGKMPGALVTGGAGAAAGANTGAVLGANAALAGGKGYRSSMGFYADKTSKEILDTLTKYFVRQGWTTS
jgi:Domain of unknown function (DUF4410)